MIKIQKFAVISLLVIISACSGCNPEPGPEEPETLNITEVSIPSSIDVVENGTITIGGKGFKLNDQIILALVSDATKVYGSTISNVTATTASFILPDDFPTGNYKLTVKRGEESLLLGSFTINVIVDTTIPDISGMTVKGIVYCNGAGIPGVVVSDGYEVTVTNDKGIYYLPSQKKTGFVFISLPGNYEVSSSDNIPQFFKRLSGGTTVEQKDFSLTQADNSKHVVLALADWHLANRNDDLSQYNTWFIPDINSIISGYAASGTKVYGIALGDMTWDAYWYENNFRLPDYLTQMSKINCKIFNIMGNHDNDPYCAGDWIAENKFREVVGPTYYSFNLGSIHYVVLDNVEYINTGGSQGVIGDRNYNDVIVYDQMEWLKKDLAKVSDKNAPLIIAMHTQLFSNPVLDANGNQTSTIHLNNGSALLTALQGFTDVHFLTGHTHINYSASQSASVMEHNTAAVSATWWWTGKSGYAGNHICKDGSPGGYGVWEIDGTDARWFYKSMGKPKSYQFRTYDLNSVHITAARYAPNSTDAALAPYAGVYANPNYNNEVLINVWGYDPEWTVEVREGGTPLAVTRVSAMDPLHIISYEAKRLNAGAVPTSSFVTGTTAHMFRVTATSAASTLDIKVTDRFGNVYTETMTRPKDLTYLMQ